MAKINVCGNAAVISMGVTLENIKTLEKYKPKALRLIEADDDGNKEEVFRIETVSEGGGISKYGASFSSTTHGPEKFAAITLALPNDVDDVTKYVADKFGLAIMRLNKVEAQFADALTAVAAEQAAILGNITVTV